MRNSTGMIHSDVQLQLRIPTKLFSQLRTGCISEVRGSEIDWPVISNFNQNTTAPIGL